MSLAASLLQGDVRPLAKAISLAAATREVIHLLDAYGRDVIIVETVGVGQSELEIGTVCDTTVLVLVPESGDAVQSIKAGIMEIADIFVINKADLGGAEKTRRLIQDAMALGPAPAWAPPILLTAAIKDQGGVELWQAIERHWEYLSQGGGLQDRRLPRLKQEVLALVAEQARDDARQQLEGDTPVARRLRQNPNGTLNPYALAAE